MKITQNKFTGIFFAALFAAVISICTPARGSLILVDFGAASGTNGAPTVSPDTNGNYWNNSYTGSLNIANLITTANATTGIALNWTQTGAGANSAGMLNTYTPGAPGPLNIETAYEDAIFTTSTSVFNSFTLSGLSPLYTYTISLFGSRVQTDYRATDYSVIGSTTLPTITIQTTGTNIGGTGINANIANLATFSSVIPSGTNTIIVDYKASSGSGFGYLNAMEVQINPVPEPATVATGLACVVVGLAGVSRRILRSRRA